MSQQEIKAKPKPLLDKSMFKIGIICALGKEANAVRSSFDHIFLHRREWPKTDSGDGNTYTFGIIGDHHIVLATIGGTGNVQATDAAKDMERSFQNIRLCLLVGICGIVPKINTEDTVLGDVVVSQEIVYYTKGKEYPTGHKIEQMLAKASKTMIRGFEQLCSPQHWKAFCEEVHQWLAELVEDEFIKKLKYEYPGRQTDKLYHADYLHIHHDGNCINCEAQRYCDLAVRSTCEELLCSQAHLVQRNSSAQTTSSSTLANKLSDTEVSKNENTPSRSTLDPTYLPRIYGGKMASGDVVLKNGIARDKYAAEHDVIAFEMEGAGVSFTFPTVVIKAACDYADSHKNKSWQEWAAVTAAACAKAFIGQVQMGIATNVQYYSQDSVEPQLRAQKTLESSDNAGPSNEPRWENSSSHVDRHDVYDQPVGQRSNDINLGEAWADYQIQFDETYLEIFQKYKCTSIEVYVEKMVAACKSHRDPDIHQKIYTWFEILFKAVSILAPFAESKLGAAAIAGSTTLGGIVGLIVTTEHLFEYQKKVMQMLSQVGDLMKGVLAYEEELNNDTSFYQQTLLLLYGDILSFSFKGFSFLKANDAVKMKKFRFTTFREFESNLKGVLNIFEQHMEAFKTKAIRRDQMRLKEIQRTQSMKSSSSRHHIDGEVEDFQYHDRSLRQISLRIERNKQELENESRRKAQLPALDWLSVLDFSQIITEITLQHLEGTGDWLLNNEEYISWKTNKSKSRLLWIKGKPGSGKSVLAARVSLDLSLTVAQSDVSVSVFCRREQQAIQSRTTILGSIVRQIIDQRKCPIRILDDDFRLQSGNAQINFINRALKEAIMMCSIVYIVIDGLDECTEDDSINLARDLAGLIKDPDQGTVKIIVFSRPDVNFSASFGVVTEIRPDHLHNEADLRAYIESIIDEDGGQNDVPNGIVDQCLQKAQGLFLWANLFGKSIQNQKTRRYVLRHLDTIKNGLKGLYDILLASIHETIRPTAWLIFLWITKAKRPLHSRAMLDAISNKETVSRLVDLDREPNEEHLVSICANLIFINQDRLVCLIHDSVRDHLESVDSVEVANKPTLQREYHSLLKHAHRILGEACLRYLLLQDFEQAIATNIRQLLAINIKAPFLGYAAAYWGWHVSLATGSASLDSFVQVLINSRPRRELCLQIFYREIESRTFYNFKAIPGPLHLLAPFGLVKQAQDLIPNASTLVWDEGVFGLAVHSTCYFKHHDMTCWLLELMQNHLTEYISIEHFQHLLITSVINGWSDVLETLISHDRNRHINKVTIGKGWALLAVAVSFGHSMIVSTLINHGANVNVYGPDEITPLMLATSNESIHLINLLLEAGADVSATDIRGQTALHFAASRNNEAATIALLAAGADFNAKASGLGNATMLHVAATSNATNTIRAITKLCPDCNVNIKTDAGLTALHAAAFYNSAAFTAALLELGSALNNQSLYGETAAYIATKQLALETLKILLSRGADVALQNRFNKTALHVAASSGKDGLLQLLVKAQPRENWKRLLNIPDVNNETVVHAAIAANDLKALTFALNAGADPDARGLINSSPLHYAAHYGCIEILSLLLSRTKECHPCNDNGDRPLHLAAVRGHLEVIQELFRVYDAKGLSLEMNAQSKSGNTALAHAIRFGHPQAAMFLLKKGARSLPNNEGDYPIHLAAYRGLDSLVEILLDHPGISAIGSQKSTLLHCAAVSGRFSLIQLVFPRCKNQLEALNESNQTPVMLAVASGHIEVTNFLLDNQANDGIVDNRKDNLLHHAVRCKNLSLVIRLTQRDASKACAGNMIGLTPLLLAILLRAQDIVKHLIEISPRAIEVPSFTGLTCQHSAAYIGSIELLQKLQSFGADISSHDLFGSSLVHTAAAAGQYKMLLYLEAQGCSLQTRNIDGYTPLMEAVYYGQMQTALYLLNKSSKEEINIVSKFGRQSAVMIAAMRGFSELIKPLLDAGAVPIYHDCTGRTIMNYSNTSSEFLELLSAIGATREINQGHNSEQMLHMSILKYCELLEGSTVSETSIPELILRRFILQGLSQSVRSSQDFGALAMCMAERNWGHELPSFYSVFRCHHCFQSLLDAVYICKSCTDEKFLCKECLHLYERNGRRISKALQTIHNLETELRAIRLILSEARSEASIAGIFHITPHRWLARIVSRYEEWESTHNSDKKYARVPRPGQKFVQIMEALCKISDQNFERPKYVASDTLREKLANIMEEYHSLMSEHPPAQLPPDISCAGHEYLVATLQERNAMKEAGIFLDKETGRMSDRYIRSLKEKYQAIQQSQQDLLAKSSIEAADFEIDSVSITHDGPTIEIPSQVSGTRIPQDVYMEDMKILQAMIENPKTPIPPLDELRSLYLLIHTNLDLDDDLLMSWSTGWQITAIIVPGSFEPYANECLRKMIMEEEQSY